MSRLLPPQLGVRTKFILLLLLFGLFPAVVLYFILLSNGQGVTNLMLARVEAAARELGQSMSYTLRERLSDVQAFTLNAAARDPAEWDGGSGSPLVEAINGYVEHYGVYPLSVVVDTSGKAIASNTLTAARERIDPALLADLDFGHTAWFGAAAATGRPGRLDVYVGQPQQIPEVAAIDGGDGTAIVFAAPIRNDAGTTIAYWVNFADFAIVRDLVAALITRLGGDGLSSVRVTVLDRLGGIVLDWNNALDSAEDDYVRGASAATQVLPPGIDDAIREAAIGGANGAVVTDRPDGDTSEAVGFAGRVMAADSPALDWSVLVTVPLDEALARWHALLRAMLIAVLLAACVIVVAGFGLGTMFTQPIRKLKEVMTTFGADQADAPIPYVERSDELGAMARALVVFRDGMQRAGAAAAERKAKEDLERQVLERTMELAQATGILAERGAWLEGILSSLPIAVGLIEAPSAQVILANRQLIELIGAPMAGSETLDLECYRTDGSLCPVDERPSARVLRGEILRGEEIEIRRERKLSRFLSVNAAPIRDAQGRITAAVLVFEDVTAKREASERIRQLALFDPLTNLPNRRSLQGDLNQALARAAAESTDAALFLIDLDDFKTVNDIRGHHIGDQVLIEVAERLRGSVRSGDHVARLGGDEFAIVATDFASLEELSRRADRILGALRIEFKATEGAVDIRGSVGIAVSPRGTVAAEELFQMGDLALYAAKRAGGGMKRFFEPEMRLRALELSRADAELPRALRDGELEVFFQPIMALASMTVASVEALLRWRHPERGLLAPGEFLHHAVRNKQVVPITFFVVTESLRQLAQWRRSGLNDFRMAINLSAAALIDEDLPDHIARRLVTEGLKGSDVILEVTEEAINEFERSVTALHRFREMGLIIAIDDFGTGHSSLARLRELPIDLIKIDRAFMKPDAHTSAILGAMINLSRSLGIPVAVEGVEEAEHVEALKGADATYAQGYYFARPMPAAALETWLRARGESETARRPRLVTY